jgi:Bacterial alpha-L-rhamnosidase 6 hairpin glycosidase domain/Alpha-L-rhamnosidase N-terminal domain/Bacterial alpha-L-rhamnosidase concanavalin-like domain/Bacterial alpha-L-rhamnosidase C-terminal domain
MAARVRTRLAAVAAGCTLLLVGVWLLAGPASAPAGPAGSGVSATTLRVDTQTNPIGLGDATPALSWRLAGGRQSAYQIRVASSEAQLGQPDLWDSGKVTSSDSTNILYDGAALKSRQAAVWDVRVWDGSGAAGDWSDPATFELGLLSNSDWSAKWIENPDYTYATADVPNPLPIFAKPFDLSRSVAKARLYMTGLGQYAAKLNGQPVGDAVLEPGQTSYFAEVNYRTYDVTRLLRQGANLLGIETGSGAYQRVRTGGRYFFQNNPAPVYGAPKTIAQLEITYADGSTQTIGTDTSWKTQLGPTTFSSWWSGEDYDARRQPTDWTASSTLNGTWRDAGLVTLTSTTTPTDTTPLIADPRPPVTVAREARPVAINQITRAPLNTTLVGPASAGDTNVKLASVLGLNPGDTLSIEGDDRKITAVGTGAGAATTVFSPASAGDTNLKVGSVTGFIAGQRALVDNEVVVVSAVGTAGTATTLSSAAAVGASNLRVASVANLAAGDSLTINTGANQETVTITSVGTAGANGTGIGITPALTRAQASGTTVRDQSKAGTGLTLSAPLTSAHALGATARGAGTGVTLASALGAPHASGVAATSAPGPTYVLDFGKQLSGLPKVSVSGPAATTVTLIPSETVNADGTLNIGSTGASATSQILYRYTLSGNGAETWHAQFTYNGFRYLQVTGLAAAPAQDNVTVLVTHASNRETATFDSSSDLLDQIYAISKQALENNMQSVLTDCPDREKGPYTGDNLHNIDTELTLFDMQMYQGQLVNNMRTAQRPVPANGQFPGMIANIAPEYHFVPPSTGGTWFLDEPNWGGAVIMVPWSLYEVYGDTAAMRANYDAMVKWLDWEATTKAANNGNIRGLGDWSAAQSTTAQAVIDYGYYRGANTMAKIADLLGKSADAGKYSQLATSLAAEYNAKYLHTDDAGHAWYANNTEASNAVALDAGLVPAQYHDAVVDSLVAAVSAFGNRIGTGSVGIGPLFRTLHAAGRDDVIYKMVANPASPGYAFLVNSGKTTLTESLSGTGSQDHHFLGQVASWFVHGLVGIEQAPGSIAYRSLVVKPALVGDLNHAEGTYTTPNGVASSSWTKAANGLLSRLDVTVPANTSARVFVPAPSPTETFVANGSASVNYVGYQDGAQVYEVADGDATFVHGTSSDTTVGGTVPATLSLSLGPAASFGAFTPGVAKDYAAQTTANVISTAGDAALGVSDPGHLSNGAFVLPEPLQVSLSKASWTGPVSNDVVTIAFRQRINADDALRTGTYAKTLTFTLSTTTP